MRRRRLACGAWLLAAVIPITAAAQTPPATPAPGTQTVVTATATVRGRVVDNNGVPVRSAEVRLNAADGRDNRVTTTDVGGQFEIRDLTPGRWNLRASKPGFVTQSASQASPLDQDRPLTIANGQRLTTDVVLGRAGAISGRVVDAAGDPLPDIQVMALRLRTIQGRRQLTSAGVPDVTDDTGSFRLYSLAPGTYYVGALATRQPRIEIVNAVTRISELLVEEIATYYPGVRDIDGAQTIEIAAGQEQPGISLTVPPPIKGVTVSGRVLDASGLVAERPRVRITPRGGVVTNSPLQGLANADAAGRFSIRNIPPGEYVVDAEITTGKFVEHGALTISVNASDVDNLVLTTTQPRDLRGVLVSESNTPLPAGFRAAISVESPERIAGGMSRMEIPPGADFPVPGIIGVHAIKVELLTPGWLVRSIDLAGQDISNGLFDFSTVPASATLRVVVSDRVGELAGQVTSRTRQRQAAIVVFPEDETKWRYPARLVSVGRSDDQGRYAIPGLLTNTEYRAVAVSYLEPEESQDPAFLAKMRSSAVRFELRDGERKTLDLPLIQR